MRPAGEWVAMAEEAGLEVLFVDRRGHLVHPQALIIARPRRAASTDTPDDVETT
jgi:hypothetical protein